MWLAFWDKFFFVFHSCVVLFILFGWTWRKTRKANLAVILMTAFSWFFLGIWYGFGYCPCTDWHWKVKGKLGQGDLPDSYIKYLADSFTGMDFDASVLNYLTAGTFFFVFFISVYVNYKDWRRKKQ